MLLCYVMLHACYVMISCVILYHVMLCYVMLCYDMLCYVMMCYVMMCNVILCYVMLCYATLCCNPVMRCYVMLCYVMLCYVVLCCRWESVGWFHACAWARHWRLCRLTVLSFLIKITELFMTFTIMFASSKSASA